MNHAGTKSHDDRGAVGRPRRGAVLRAGMLCTLLLAAANARAAGQVQFNRDVRPILSENCFYCHGPDKNQRKAKLRLDERESAIEQGALTPGQPAESALIARIFSTDPKELMPPPKTHKRLTARQKELLRRWVAEGAGYEPHWAYLAPQRPPLPAPPSAPLGKASPEGAWGHNPIDAFILTTLESKGLRPSPEADRRTLLRRLSLDLTGLPPTPEEVRDFVNDPDPRAYERQVDRLLASPHFGERMAVPWLDLVRFSDTVGYHGDQNQRVFPYRDYVIEAFNRNKPFDEFTVEQLAGDLLPGATTEQRVATGFNRLNMMTREGGAQPKEYLAKYAADRVRTVAITWLGSTMGCAECHDHKFDPFKTKDFYSLAAFFADVKQWGVYADYGYTPNPDLKGWTNDHPFPPEVEVASPYLQRRQERLRQQIRQVVSESAAARISTDAPGQAAFDRWTRASRAFLQQAPGGWVTPPAEVGPDGTVQPDGSVLFPGKAKKGDEPKVRLRPAAGWLAAVRLEVLPHRKHHGKVVRDGAESTRIHLSASVERANTRRETRLAFAHADADYKEVRYANGSALLGVTEGWQTSGRHSQSAQTSVWLLDQPLQLHDGDRLLVTIRSDNVGCVRLSLSPFGGEDPGQAGAGEALLRALDAAPAARTPDQQELLHATYLRGTGWDADAFAQVKTLQREVRECRGGRAFTMVTEAGEPRPTRVLPRGNWQDESGELVLPAVPRFLPQPPNPEGRRLTRLDLARWLTAPENPLTARVFVNRLWKQFFGTGISGVLEDVGAQGEWPVHPALLDWLAVEFMKPSTPPRADKKGWDVKHMVKLLVMSATYRQDSRLRSELRDLDPNNRLLAAQSPRRLEAEFVRDNALAIAGLLNRDVGGPSARPYQPAGYYANLQFPNRDYGADRDDRQYRRGVYTHWQRTFLHPMLANFDAPSREECTATRTVANTPQQALTLLNDPTFVEAARVLAQKVLASSATSDGERLDFLYHQALARPALAKEKQSLTAFLAGQRKTYGDDVEGAKKLIHVGLTPVPAGAQESELAAWTSVCRVVLNLHETITRY